MNLKLSDLLNLLQNPIPSQKADVRARCGYAVLRVSGNSQDEEAQRADIERACQRHNLTVTRWHGERERANNVDARVGLFQLIEDAKRDPECEFIICRDPSRLFRDDALIEHVELELAAHGVRLIDDYRFVNFGEDDLTPQEIWRKGINRLQGKAYSAQVRDWTMKSMSHICQQRDPDTGWAYHLGGLSLFGYKRVKVSTNQIDKRGHTIERELWLLNDEVNPVLKKPVWEIVREMWLNWYIKKEWGEERIARYLTECGVKSPRGGPISISTVHYLHSPVALLTYTGYYIWNKWGFKRLGRRGQKVLKPPTEWLWVPNAHPPIFTLEEVEQIEKCVSERSEKFKKRRVSPRAESSRTYALVGGMAKCSVCGSNIVGYGYHHRGEREYAYYWCGTWQYRAGAGCGPRFSVPCHLLEQGILEWAKKMFPITPESAEEWARKRNESIRRKFGQIEPQRKAVQKRIAQIDSQIDNLIEVIAQGGLSIVKRIQKRIEQLQQERTQLQRDLQTLSAQIVPEVKAEDVIEFYNRLEDAAMSTDAQKWRKVIRGVVDTITFFPHERKVRVRFHGGGLVTNYLVAPRGVEPRLPD